MKTREQEGVGGGAHETGRRTLRGRRGVSEQDKAWKLSRIGLSIRTQRLACIGDENA